MDTTTLDGLQALVHNGLVAQVLHKVHRGTLGEDGIPIGRERCLDETMPSFIGR